MSIRASRNLPAYSVESLASTSPSWAAPWARGDQNSTTTGTCSERSITSLWNVASLTFSTYDPAAPPLGAPAPGPGAPAGAPAGRRRADRSIAPGREKLDWLTTVLAFRSRPEGAHRVRSQVYPLRRYSSLGCPGSQEYPGAAAPRPCY